MTAISSYKLYLFLYFSLCMLICCKQEKRQYAMNYAITDERIEVALIPYTQVVQAIKRKFTYFQKQKLHDSTRSLIYNSIAETMPSYWNGTPWDFNGTTQVPGQGNIACGYFVTTLLRDIGYKINRVKLAQQASSVIVKSTCTKVEYLKNIEAVNNYIVALPVKSIAIVGLDFHTGFIIKKSTGIYFLHSNYINKQGVVMEPLQQSKAFNTSKTFMIGLLQ